MNIEIKYADEFLIPGFYDALSVVAKERIYIEMIQPPPIEKVTEFQRSLIAKSGPVYYAVDGDRVVGWCDVFPEDNPRQSHRGSLGMGCLPEYCYLSV